MTKVIKLKLKSKNENLDYKQVNHILWDLQHEARAIANRTIQYCWEYSGFESDYKAQFGDYPDKAQRAQYTGYGAMSSLLYSQISKEFNKNNTGNISQMLQGLTTRWKTDKPDIYRGNKSIPSFKKSIPIDVAKRNITLWCEKEDNGGVARWGVTLSLLSKAYKNELGLDKGQLSFVTIAPPRSGKSVRTILERCYDGVYGISASKLKYDEKAKRWYLYLCYNFEKEKSSSLDPGRIMGIHIAKNNAVTMAYDFNKYTDKIDGGEVLAFAAQIENRRRSIQTATRKGSLLCGDGRVGHGYAKKMQPLEHISNTISNFRNTTNHRYSKEIVNKALKNKCGVIQIEDLTGYSDEVASTALLQNWSYYDLTQKIEYKAKAEGIKVVKLSYGRLHQWCNDCQSKSVIKEEDDIGGIKYKCGICGQYIDFENNILKALTDPDIADKLSQSDAADPDINAIID